MERGIPYHSSNFKLWKRIGDIQFKLAEYPKAVEAYKKAETLGDNSAATLRQLGASYLFQGEPDSAFTKLVQSYQQDSTDALTCYYLGVSLLGKETSPQAVSLLHKATELLPTAFLSRIYEQMGKAYELAGKLRRAVKAYRLAVELDPSNPEIYFQLAALYERNYADHTPAMAYYQKVVAMSDKASPELVSQAGTRLKILREKVHFRK